MRWARIIRRGAAAEAALLARRLKAVDHELIGICTAGVPGHRSALTLGGQDALAKVQRDLRAFRENLEAKLTSLAPPPPFRVLPPKGRARG